MRVPKLVNLLWDSKSTYTYGFDMKRFDVICKHRHMGMMVMVMLLAVMLMPNVAYAEDLGSSFTSGLQTTWSGDVKNEQVSPEKDFVESYVPTVHEVRTVPSEDEDDGSILGKIQSTLNALQRVQIDATTLTPVGFLYWLFGGYAGTSKMVVTAAVGMVFMWWGVRKAIRIIMGTARGRKLHV